MGLYDDYYGKIKKCFMNRQFSDSLMVQYSNRTQTVLPPSAQIPSIVINGVSSWQIFKSFTVLTIFPREQSTDKYSRLLIIGRVTMSVSLSITEIFPFQVYNETEQDDAKNNLGNVLCKYIHPKVVGLC